MSEKKKNIGGQAVIEGVMMRAPSKFVIAVRQPNGTIAVKRDDIKLDSNKILNKPILRGLIGLYDALVLGIKALNFSAEKAMPDEFEKEGTSSKLETFFSMALGLLLGIVLFLYLPLQLTELSKKLFPIVEYSFLVFNLVDGVLRIIFFVLYLLIISQMKDIKRVFSYHGAEHKCIFTYEKGQELTVENARKMSRFHPRCGTSFLLIVLLVSIFVFSLIPKDSHFLIKFGSRIIFLPLIAGISYEILKLSGRYADNLIVKILIAPGLWLQRITTREPDDSMLEVAIVSIKEALRKDDDETYQKPENVEYCN